MTRFIQAPVPEATPRPRKRRAKAVTLADVARAAGTAKSTASAVLGQKAYCFASEETRKRILDAAARLRYRPNTLSRGLQGLATRKIAVLLSSIGSTSVASDNLRSIETLAWEHDYRLTFGSHRGEREREQEYLNAFESECVDGLIVTPSEEGRSDALEDLLERGVPLVTLDARQPLPAPGVRVDRELGGYLQVKHLLDLGRRKLAFLLTSVHSPTGQAKIAGIRRALNEAGMDLDAFPQATDAASLGSRAGAVGAEMMNTLLAHEHPVDAVVTLSDSIAVGAMRALQQAGRSIPNDVAVVGFDDDPYAAHLSVPLTTVRQPRGKAGEAAFRLLLQQLQLPPDEKPSCEQIVLQPQLIIRESTVGPQVSVSTPGH